MYFNTFLIVTVICTKFMLLHLKEFWPYSFKWPAMHTWQCLILINALKSFVWIKFHAMFWILNLCVFNCRFSTKVTCIFYCRKPYKNYESRKFVVRFWHHWRPLEGIHFHWRGLKKCFLQFKTLRRVICIPLEGFRYLSRRIIIPLEGFRNFSRGLINPLKGFRYLFRGFIIPLEGFRHPS